MIRLLEIIRIYLISIEALIVILIIVSAHYFPSIFILIGSKIKSSSEVWKFMPSIPLGMTVISIRLAWKILAPLGNSKTNILYQWEFYWKLKYRVIASIIICGITAIASIMIWILSSYLSDLTIGSIFISSLAVSVTVVFTQLLAAFRMREYMDL